MFQTGLLVLWLGLAAQSAVAQALLHRGSPATGYLRGNATATFAVRLQRGEAAFLRIRQFNADLRVRADGVWQPNAFEFGPDPVALIAERSGDILFEVQCVRPPSAPAYFTAELVTLSKATETDRKRRELIERAALLRVKTAGSKPVTDWAPEAEEIAEHFRAAGDSLSEVQVDSLLGVGFFSADQFERSESLFRRALARIEPQSEPMLRADLLHNIAICTRYLGRFDEAIELYRRARDQWRRLPVRTTNEAATLSSVGVLLCETGECGQAIAYQREAVQLLKAFGGPYSLAMAIQNLGAAYTVLGDNAFAANQIEASLPLFRAAGNPRALARALMNLAVVRVEQQRLGDAFRLVSEALALLPGRDRFRGDALSTLCKIQTRTGNPSLGEAPCREGLAILRTTTDRRAEATVRHNLGTNLIAQRKLDEAAEMLRSALDIRKIVQNPAGTIETLTVLAQLERTRRQLEDAAAFAREAVTEVESVRARVIAERLRTSWFASRQATYETYISVLMSQHTAEPDRGHDVTALEFAERRRARTLIDMLAGTGSSLRTSSDPELVRQRAQLMRRINFLAAQKTAAETQRDSGERTRLLMQQIDDSLRDLEQVEARMRSADPRIFELLQPPEPKADRIQALLSDRDVLVEYAVCHDDIVAWVVTKDRIRSFVLSNRERVERTAERVTNLLSRFRERQKDAALQRQYQLAVTALHRAIYAPVEAELKGRRLVVVADGALQTVPFAALSGTSRQVVQLPSAWTLVTRRSMEQRPRSGSKVVIFADPVFDAADPRVPVADKSRTTGQHSLPRLLFSRDEVKVIEQLVRPERREIFVDFGASKARFLSQAFTSCQVLHLSTHAITDVERPELSSVFLSQVDARGRSVDGRLQLYELYNMRTPADLVTLSACATGAGKPVRGEGIVGLTRAFLFGGAKSVLVTFWPVEDEGTAAFMREFYRRLLGERPMTPIAALRAAQEAMAASDRWRDPYYWAGFVLQGEWR